MSWPRVLLLGTGPGALIGLAVGWLTPWAFLLLPPALALTVGAIVDAEDQA